MTAITRRATLALGAFSVAVALLRQRIPALSMAPVTSC